MKPADQIEHPGLFAQIENSGTAGKNQKIKILVKHLGKQAIRMEGELGSAGNEQVFADCGHGDLNLCPAEQVDGTGGFDFLKAGGEQERDEVLGILESLHAHVVTGADGASPDYFGGYENAGEAKAE